MLVAGLTDGGLSVGPDTQVDAGAVAGAVGLVGLILTAEDYVLGVFDAVGEIMRWAITNLALANARTNGEDKDVGQQQVIVHDLRALRVELEGLRLAGSGLEGDAGRKMEVMRTCVEKVENAVYGLCVRGSERPEGWVPTSSSNEVEGY